MMRRVPATRRRPYSTASAPATTTNGNDGYRCATNNSGDDGGANHGGGDGSNRGDRKYQCGETRKILGCHRTLRNNREPSVFTPWLSLTLLFDFSNFGSDYSTIEYCMGSVGSVAQSRSAKLTYP